MKREAAEFAENARRVYWAVRKAVEESGAFCGIRCDDRASQIMATLRLPLWSESIHVVQDMTVEVVTPSFSNPDTTNGGLLQADTFMRLCGLDIRNAGALNMLHLNVQQY